MQLVIFACLAAVAIAAPQVPREGEHIGIIRDERIDNGDGHFTFEFETENGIHQLVNGRPGANGGQEMEGSFRFPLDDGTIVEVQYTADERGYLPISDVLPTAHPLPAHVVETLAIIDELVRGGATWDDQGNRLTRRK